MCSYCGCESLEVVGRFMAEHVEIINASGALRRALESGDVATIADAGATLIGRLGPHTSAEEVGLFAVMREQGEFTDHIDTLCGEHATLDDLLARVLAGEHELFPTFELALRRHIDKEDNGLFPASAIALVGPDWERVVEQTPPAT